MTPSFDTGVVEAMVKTAITQALIDKVIARVPETRAGSKRLTDWGMMQALQKHRRPSHYMITRAQRARRDAAGVAALGRSIEIDKALKPRAQKILDEAKRIKTRALGGAAKVVDKLTPGSVKRGRRAEAMRSAFYSAPKPYTPAELEYMREMGITSLKG